jgi:hypothetical protein
MKKFFLLGALLLLSLCTFAQTPYVAVSYDVINGIGKTDDNNHNPEANITIRAGAVTNADNIKLGLLYQAFPSLDFQRVAAEAGWDFTLLPKLHFEPTAEFGRIFTPAQDVWSVGLNADTTYYFSSVLGLVVTYNVLNNDVSQETNHNALLGLKWKPGAKVPKKK